MLKIAKWNSSSGKTLNTYTNLNIDHKINSIENTMKSLMNKNTVVYSNHSKTSDTLSNGICSLTINSINKSFIFTYAKNKITISPLNNSITNLQFINEISVDDLITAKNIMNNQYLIDTFSNINKILEIYQKYVKIENETVMINKLLINGVDIEKELSDLNRYVDRYIEDADVKFEVINESILNLNNNTITVNEEISDINDKYTEFREEFKNHTHDGQYVKPVDIEELRTKMTGIEYNKVKIGTVEEEEVYEIYTSIDHDLKVNGYINGIDITKLLKLENDALIIKDILSFNSLINLVSSDETESDAKLIIRFPNDNSIVFESSGIISSVTSKSNKFYYDNFLTKQMLIDDEDIIDILFNKITDENGNTTSSPKKSAVEQIFDIIDFGLTILDTAATVGPMIAQIKKFGWTGYLYKTFGIVSSKSGGYIPLELLTNTVMTRSVIIDDSTNTDNVESYESPNYEDVDEDFNEFQYVANLFPSIDKIFASLKRYYSNVEKGQRTNYLGLLLVDAQIHDKLMNHTHDEFALIDHVHSYNDLTDVPETFTPSEHTHDYNSLTNIPESFTPSEHNHDSLYSKLDHTHTTFNNRLTVNSYRFDLLSKGHYTYLNIGHKSANYQSIQFGYGDDAMGKYGYWRVLGGTQLTIFTDKMTFPGELTISTLNGIDPSNISLNGHTHSYNDLTNIPETFTPSEHTHSFTSLTDIPETFTPSEHTHSFTSLTDIPDTFPPAEHNHDTLYSTINHTHNYNDLTDIPTSFNPSEHTHSYKSLTDIPTSFNPSEHNHDTLYSAINHTHSYNDLTDIPELALANHTHTTFNNNLTINSNQESTSITIGGNGYVSCVDLLGESELDLGVGGYDLIIKNNAINYNGSMNLITLNTSTINSCQISDTFTLNAPYIQTVGWFPFNVMMNVDFHNQTDQNYIWRLKGIDNSFTLQKYGNDSIFEFSIVDSSHPLYTAKGGSENSTGFCIKNSSTNNWWRFATAYNSKAHEEYLRLYWNKIYLCYFENCDDDINQLNTTITHNAPLEECLDIFELGCPVFMSGEVYNLKNGNYTKETNTIDCIPSVKSTGTYKEFLGIVVNKHKSGDKVKIGDVMKKDVIINQDTIDFATHGDYYFRVDDSSKYKIGDTVLYDGSIVDDDVPITNKIIKSTIGSITGIINEHYVSVFKS